MLLTLHTFVVAWTLGLVVSAYTGTTTFDSILLAHPSPSICPTESREWQPDGNYIACCDNYWGTHTLTSGRGPGGTTVYACCYSGYTCTGAVSLMKDWTIDANSMRARTTAMLQHTG